MISIGFIAKAFNEQDSSALKKVFRVMKDLAPSHQFISRLCFLEVREDSKVLEENERHVLELFLRGIGVNLDPLSSKISEMPLLDDTTVLETRQIIDGKLDVPMTFDQSKRTDRWIISGNVPTGILYQIYERDDANTSVCSASNLTSVTLEEIKYISGVDDPAPIKQMSNQRVPIYGAQEEALSSVTSAVARRLVGALRDIIGPHESQDWLEALELPADDLLFATTIDFWSVLSDIKSSLSSGHKLVVSSTDTVRAYLAGIRALEISASVTLVAPDIETIDDDSPDRFCRDLLAQVFGDSDPPSINALRDAAMASLSSNRDGGQPKRGSAFLIGRNFDRNYASDLRALGNELSKDHRVIFVPTAGQRGRRMITSVIKTAMDSWHDGCIYDPAYALWSPLHAGDQTVRDTAMSVLIAQAQANEPFSLEETAVLAFASKQLVGFFGDRIFRYLKSGTSMSKCIVDYAPRYMALMPGRDYIARVAALAGRANGTLSFDVQTVFVGPRARYKVTAADIQFTIETESERLFQSYFGMSPDKTVLTGCAKVGQVQKAARNLDVARLQELTGLAVQQLIVFAGSPFLEKDRSILETLAGSVRCLQNVHLGVRLHPTAKSGYPEFLAELERTNAAVSELKRLNLPQTLSAADILITRFSNVGLEAALLGTNVIACNFDDGIVPIKLHEMGVSAIANSPQELLDCIEDFRCQGPIWARLQVTRETYIAKNAQLLEPVPAKKMYSVMEKTLEQSRQN